MVLAMREVDGEEDEGAGDMRGQQPIELGEAVDVDEPGDKAEAHDEGLVFEFLHVEPARDETGRAGLSPPS